MHSIINKIIYTLLAVIIVIMLSFFIYQNHFEKKEYSINLDTLDTKATIKLYNISNYNSNKSFKKIINLLKEYDNLLNDSKEMGHNLYYINNKSNNKYIDIDKKLYDLISYGKSWYDKSDGLIDISSGDIKEAYKKDKEDLESFKKDINDIELKDGKIKNNHVHINLDDVKIGYVVDEVSKLLEKNNIKDYYIYIGGVVSVGKHKNKFSIGLENPSNKEIYKVLYGNNICSSTIDYHKTVLNLKTYKEADSVYSLSIIGKNASDTYVISNIAYIKSLEDSMNYINDLDGYEGIWFKFDKKYIESNNLKKYDK